MISHDNIDMIFAEIIDNRGNLKYFYSRNSIIYKIISIEESITCQCLYHENTVFAALIELSNYTKFCSRYSLNIPLALAFHCHIRAIHYQWMTLLILIVGVISTSTDYYSIERISSLIGLIILHDAVPNAFECRISSFSQSYSSSTRAHKHSFDDYWWSI